MRAELFGVAAVISSIALVGIAHANYDEWFKFPKLRTGIIAHTKDPSSVMYRNERLSPGGSLCGEYNAKNGYGAYTGYKRFIGRSDGEAYVEDVGLLHADGSAPSHEFVMDILSNRIEILKEFNATAAIIKETDPDATIKAPSESEQEQKAVARYFDKKWRELCS